MHIHIYAHIHTHTHIHKFKLNVRNEPNSTACMHACAESRDQRSAPANSGNRCQRGVVCGRHAQEQSCKRAPEVPSCVHVDIWFVFVSLVLYVRISIRG